MHIITPYVGKRSKKLNIIDVVIDIFEDNYWDSITITMPQNGDKVTLTPVFYDGMTPSRNALKMLKVEGAAMPISGTIDFVVRNLQNYQHLIELRQDLDAFYATAPAQVDEFDPDFV